MNHRSSLAPLFALPLIAIAGAASAQTAPKALASLTVTNPLDMARTDEVIDLPLSDVLSHAKGAKADTLAVRDAADGGALVTQLIDESGTGSPDHLLILADLKAKQTRNLELFTAAAPAAPTPRVFGRFAPERKDDFAWESDVIAFRMYGPALQEQKNEISSGVDVWCKRAQKLIIDEWYARETESEKIGKEAVHHDIGDGLDCYKVEPLRGCGGVGIWADDKLAVSKNYTHWKILASGPIRFVFELTYAPWDAAGVSVSEVKRISIDAGSHLNRMQSTFHYEGGAPLTVAAAIALHKGAVLNAPKSGGPISVWEPADGDRSWIATGMILPPGTKADFKEIPSEALYLFPVQSDKPMVYYAGAGWSKFGFPDQAAWDAYLKDYSAKLNSPLTTQWK